MKRSQSLRLTTLIAGVGVSLTACDNHAPQPPQWGDGSNGGKPVAAVSYASLADCKAKGVIPADQCQTAYEQAQKANEANAPRFGDSGSCEARFGAGQCVPRSSEGGGSFFTPLLTGFLVGRALNNFGGGGYYQGAPMYRDRSGSYFGGAGTPLVRDSSGRTSLGSEAFNGGASAPARVQSRSAVISRGGFGGGFGGEGHGYGG
jgi:uncharacterized protein YgiB involved in biofilm formation